MKNKKYQIIVADPPWPMGKIVRRVRPNQKSGMDYSLMTLKEINRINVSNICDNNCILFLWCVDSMMMSGRRLLLNWGFNYHCTMAWHKNTGPTMWGFRRNCEFILVGFKGKQEPYPKRKVVKTCFEAKNIGHSVKPNEFYEMLKVLPHEPRLEMFARQKREGWDVWGNEVKSDVNLNIL